MREKIIKYLGKEKEVDMFYDNNDIKTLQENEIVVDMKDGKSFKITIEEYK
jgi:hypothetical protein